MTYDILPTKEFLKNFGKLDTPTKERIKRKINEVAQDPTRYKHFHYALKGSCRIRIGPLRVLFSYSVERKEVYLETVVVDHQYE